jgi:hypothetical protein
LVRIISAGQSRGDAIAERVRVRYSIVIASNLARKLEVVIPESINCGVATKFMDIWDPGAEYGNFCFVASGSQIAGFLLRLVPRLENLASGMTTVSFMGILP